MPKGARPFVLMLRGTGPLVLLAQKVLYQSVLVQKVSHPVVLVFLVIVKSRAGRHEHKRSGTIWHERKLSRSGRREHKKSQIAWHMYEKSRNVRHEHKMYRISFSLFCVRAKQYETFCRIPAKLCTSHATVRDLFACLGIGPKSWDSFSFGP